MKVICVDNFNRDWMPDQLIKENLTPIEAEALAKKKNRKEGKYTDIYYRAVEDDYELYEFEP